MSNIILIGFKTVGKTTLGAQVAAKIGWPFIDTDALITPSPAEVYRTLGKDQFYAEEKRALSTLAHFSHHVIATGGGTPCDPDNAALLRRLGVVIHLKTPKETVIARLAKMPKPAFLEGRDFDTFYEERLSCYMQVAHHTIVAEDEIWDVLFPSSSYAK